MNAIAVTGNDRLAAFPIAISSPGMHSERPATDLDAGELYRS
jgi:hypothetical protein